MLSAFGPVRDPQGNEGGAFPPDEVVTAFQEELSRRALARGPHPIEGFDAAMLLATFPGLEESDFDGIETGAPPGEGIHSYVAGELRWERASEEPVTSAERSLSHEGYRTLLSNLSRRLGTPVTSEREAIAVIDAIDVGQQWETTVDPATGVSFKYPEALAVTYIEAIDWPPRAQVIEEEFRCIEAGEETDRAGRTEEREVDGRTYCVTTVADATAGSVYEQYAYAFPFGDRTMILTFSARYPQCGNYDEPERVACESEREAFDLDGVADLMARS
ncbi:MAG TPA: hypothetical protein VJ837_00850, partial [Candidatus Paceibacterota bacterium]|nr:hypothetical protein [Candidatus Paceibacterota bacterium]